MGGGVSLFYEWFPIYSFHMPLFVFISGYFYKNNSDINIIDFIKKKTKRLLVPYFIWNFTYGVIVNILNRNGIIDFGSEISFNTLFIETWVSGHHFGLNVASWFVLSLFLVQIIYVILKRLFRIIGLNNEYIIMIMFIIIGSISVLKSNQGIHMIIARTMFLIQFYNLGYFYKSKIENKYNISNYVIFIFLFIIQFVIIKKYENISFSVVFGNSYNKSKIFLPFITSITGILFWLKISEILVVSVGESKLINYIGKNTWHIMMHHQLVFFIINCIFMMSSKIYNLKDFNYEAFKNDVWYSYTGGCEKFLLFYVIAGITIPIIIKYYIETKIIIKER